MFSFYEFDPFASYVSNKDGRFYISDTELAHQHGRLQYHSEALGRLWSLGRRAMVELSHFSHREPISDIDPSFSRDDFEELASFYKKYADELRPKVAIVISQGGIDVRRVDEEPISIDKAVEEISHQSRPDVFRIAFALTVHGDPDDDVTLVYRLCFLMACLEQIGNTLVDLELNHSAALTSAMDAAEYLAYAQEILGRINLKKAERRARARENAAKSHTENRKLREEALDFYKKHRGEFKSAEAAARHISGKVVPVTQRTVVGWIRAWLKTQPAS